MTKNCTATTTKMAIMIVLMMAYPSIKPSIRLLASLLYVTLLIQRRRLLHHPLAIISFSLS